MKAGYLDLHLEAKRVLTRLVPKMDQNSPFFTMIFLKEGQSPLQPGHDMGNYLKFPHQKHTQAKY